MIKDQTEQVKTCSKCKEEKSFGDFHKDKSNKDGLNYCCKVCRCLVSRKYFKEHREESAAKHKKWAKQNPEKMAAFSKKNYKKNPEKAIARSKKWAKAHPEKVKEYSKKWARQNPEKIAASSEKDAEKNPERNKKYHRIQRENLTDIYIKKQIKKQFGLSKQIITKHPELIENFRTQIKFKRLLKQKTDENPKTS